MYEVKAHIASPAECLPPPAAYSYVGLDTAVEVSGGPHLAPESCARAACGVDELPCDRRATASQRLRTKADHPSPPHARLRQKFNQYSWQTPFTAFIPSIAPDEHDLRILLKRLEYYSGPTDPSAFGTPGHPGPSVEGGASVARNASSSGVASPVVDSAGSDEDDANSDDWSSDAEGDGSDSLSEDGVGLVGAAAHVLRLGIEGDGMAL